MRRVSRLNTYVKLLFGLVVIIGIGIISSLVSAWGFALLVDPRQLPLRRTTVIPFDTHAWALEIIEGPGVIQIERWDVNGSDYASVRAQHGEDLDVKAIEQLLAKELDLSQSIAVERKALPDWSLVFSSRPGGSPFLEYDTEDARGWPLPCFVSRRCSYAIRARLGMLKHLKEMERKGLKTIIRGDVLIINQGDGTLVEKIDLAPGSSISGGILLYANEYDTYIDFRILPIEPLFKPLLINVVFYAALWSVLLIGYSSSKRRSRTRRGLCPKCGYDLRGDYSTGCSECGWGRDDSLVQSEIKET